MKFINKSARILTINKVRIVPGNEADVDLKALTDKQRRAFDSWVESGMLEKAKNASAKINKSKDPEGKNPEGD